MPPDLHCRASIRDGTPCNAPSNLVDPNSGFCTSHDPERREELREAARRGGRATAKRFRSGGLSDEELPPLTSPEVAEVWLERIGRASATGRLRHQDATAATRAVQQWLRAHEVGVMAERMDRLRETVDELKAKR